MKAAIALFLAALAGYSVLWRDAPVLDGDSPQYMEVARDLRDLKLDVLHDRPPGYPLLLALTGSSQTPSRTLFVVSLLLHCASIAMLMFLLRLAGVGRPAVLIFCGVLLLPPFVEPAAYVMTENLAQFMLVTGLACLAAWCVNGRFLFLVISALAFGYSALTRPAYQALALVLALSLLVLRGSSPRATGDLLKAGLTLIGGTALVLGLMAWNNYRSVGYFGVVPTAGLHLSTKTMSFVERLPENYAAVREILIRERDAQLVKRGGTHTGTQTIWSARDEIAAMTGLSKPELSRYLLRMNYTLIRRAPIEYLREVARSMATYWFPAGGSLASFDLSVLRWLWTLAHVAMIGAFFLPMIVFAGVGLFESSVRAQAKAGRHRNPIDQHWATWPQLSVYALALVTVVYTMLLSCFLDIGEARQRRPTDVLIVFMGFLGINIWLRAARSRTVNSFD